MYRYTIYYIERPYATTWRSRRSAQDGASRSPNAGLAGGRNPCTRRAPRASEALDVPGERALEDGEVRPMLHPAT
jgi:hypothetical protein